MKEVSTDEGSSYFEGGGVSRISGRLLNPDEVSIPTSNYVNINACANSLKRNVIDANPDFAFDIFIQGWNPDLKPDLEYLYNPVATNFELNEKHKVLLSRLTKKSFMNSPKRMRHLVNLDFLNSSHEFRQAYAGISQALAIHQAANLFQSHGDPNKYEYVILARPDIILLKPLDLSNYLQDIVYVNQYENLMGDFHWVFSPKHLQYFSGLVTSIDTGNHHNQHIWIRDFIQHHLNGSYVEDDILAGRDEEVLRKVKNSNILIDNLREYGITESEYNSYDAV